MEEQYIFNQLEMLKSFYLVNANLPKIMQQMVAHSFFKESNQAVTINLNILIKYKY